jgi:septal ring factor EnvC (AmiA/AmiB activator)
LNEAFGKDTGRRRCITALGLLTMLCLTAAPAIAQSLAAEARALGEAKQQAVIAQQRAVELERQAAGAADDAARAQAQAQAVASRIQAAEADVAAAQARIRIVSGLRARQRARLATRQAPIARLIAGLQTMARRPAALALVQRGSIADLVHVRAVLASQLPLVRARTVALRRNVAEGIRLQAEADRAIDSLRADQRRLGQQRLLLTQLEAQHRTRAQGLTDSAMLEEDRATALGEDARDIVNLMGQASERAAIARQLASLPGPVPRPPIPGHPASTIPGPATLIANRLSYRLPVVGRLMIGLGEVSQAGVRARGLTIAPQPGTRVMAPAGGRIVYAGPFRD